MAKPKKQVEEGNPEVAAEVKDVELSAIKPGWIKATPEEVSQYQKEGILVGHDHNQGIVLLKGE